MVSSLIFSTYLFRINTAYSTRVGCKWRKPPRTFIIRCFISYFILKIIRKYMTKYSTRTLNMLSALKNELFVRKVPKVSLKRLDSMFEAYKIILLTKKWVNCVNKKCHCFLFCWRWRFLTGQGLASWSDLEKNK